MFVATPFEHYAEAIYDPNIFINETEEYKNLINIFLKDVETGARPSFSIDELKHAVIMLAIFAGVPENTLSACRYFFNSKVISNRKIAQLLKGYTKKVIPVIETRKTQLAQLSKPFDDDDIPF